MLIKIACICGVLVCAFTYKPEDSSVIKWKVVNCALIVGIVVSVVSLFMSMHKLTDML